MKAKFAPQIKNSLKLIARPLVTISIALLIGGIIIQLSGKSALAAYAALFKGAFGSTNAVLATLGKATPLIFTGLAAALASIAGVFNIGIEGQLYMGALASGVIGVTFGFLPKVILIPLCLIGAMLAAMLWALIPGLLNIKLNINIFIMFFMMNNMAILLTEFLANGPFKGELPEAATAKLPANARLYKFSVFSDLSTGFILAVVFVVVLWFLLKKTKFGYESRAIGNNRKFSEYIGIHVNNKTILILLISAAMAGLAGAEPVMGSMGRFYAGFSNEYGFTGISIALLASNNPLGVLAFALFFGALNSGGLQMAASTNIPSDLINILQSIIIVLVSGDFAIRTIRKGKAKGVKV